MVLVRKNDVTTPVATLPGYIQRLLQLRLHQRSVRLNTFGLKLFIWIMAGALMGIGGLAFLFGEILKYQAEDQIHETLETKLNNINDVIDQAEILAYGLQVGVTTLHTRKVTAPETYQTFTRKLIAGDRPFVVGLGFGQSEYGVLSEQQWFFPYYQMLKKPSQTTTQGDAGQSETLQLHYEDQSRPNNPNLFYPHTDDYRNYFLPRKSTWTKPYLTSRGPLITYYSPIFDDDQTWLGTVRVDLDGTYLSQVLAEPVLRQSGHFVLLTEAGDVIANPINPAEIGTQTYQDVPGLASVWFQIHATGEGLLEGERGYWAYVRFPEQGWMLMAFVPYAAIFERIMLITVVATGAVVLLLATVVGLAMRHLNRRLHPILQTCNRLANTDQAMLAELQTQDELDQLAIAFTNMLEQLQLSDEIIRHHEEMIRQGEKRIKEKVLQSDQVSASLQQSLRQNQATIEQNQQLLQQQTLYAGQMEAQLVRVANSVGDNAQRQMQLLSEQQDQVQTLANTAQTLPAQVAAAVNIWREMATQFNQGQQPPAAAIAQLNHLCQHQQQLADQVQSLGEQTHLFEQFMQRQGQLLTLGQALTTNAATLSMQATQLQTSDQFQRFSRQFDAIAIQMNDLGQQTYRSQVQQKQQLEQLKQSTFTIQQTLQLSHNLDTINLATILSQGQNLCRQAQAATEQALKQAQTMVESSERLVAAAPQLQLSLEQLTHLTAATLETAKTAYPLPASQLPKV